MVYPLSNLVATEQVGFGDIVIVDFNEEDEKLTFSKRSGGALVSDGEQSSRKPEEPEALSDGIGLPLPQAKAASKGKGGGEHLES
jgi:hypothetical protein